MTKTESTTGKNTAVVSTSSSSATAVTAAAASSNASSFAPIKTDKQKLSVKATDIVNNSSTVVEDNKSTENSSGVIDKNESDEESGSCSGSVGGSVLLVSVLVLLCV